MKIALTAAGAIPYYARLPALDLLGLTDAWIARNGVRMTGHQRGHVRIAPIPYLLARDVNLVFGNPVLEDPSLPEVTTYVYDILLDRPYFPWMGLEAAPPGAALVEIPVGDRVGMALLLMSHPDIEAALETKGWRRFALRR